MKKSHLNLAKAALSAILPTLLIVCLNFGTSMIGRSKGEVSISLAGQLKGQRFALIRIMNYTDAPLDGVTLESNLDLGNDIEASGPISVLKINGARSPAGSALWKVGVIKGDSETFLTVPIASTNSDPFIRLINGGSAGIDEISGDVVQKQEVMLLKRAATDGVAYFIVVMLFSLALQYYFGEKMDALHVRSSNLKDSAENLREQLGHAKEVVAELSSKVDKLGVSAARTRVIMAARLKDYSSELAFWRQAVKQLLIAGGGSDSSADKLVEIVTSTLGTYLTLSRVDFEFDEAVVISKVLADSHADGRVDKA
jgi:hypothetical protein